MKAIRFGFRKYLLQYFFGSTEQSVVVRGCNKGLDYFISEAIMELFDSIFDEIYNRVEMDDLGINPIIDVCLQALDVEISFKIHKIRV